MNTTFRAEEQRLAAYLENERKDREKRAKKREEDQLKILNSTFASVKTEFSDLDGQLERRDAQRAKNTTRPTLAPIYIPPADEVIDDWEDNSPTPRLSDFSPVSNADVDVWLESLPKFSPIPLDLDDQLQSVGPSPDIPDHRPPHQQPNFESHTQNPLLLSLYATGTWQENDALRKKYTMQVAH
ncbi:hypothetical protein BDN70DRAFT_898989 [Pholiota conissans]|uniref:Uncharacterized protein n=1 Tax=Pholiota conissans TaxID=109636 RepID=A0A9P5YS18_9AGAR|nr:hypothetical protein BDN70DRAFT_898989 [Pholiota conissans]